MNDVTDQMTRLTREIGARKVRRDKVEEADLVDELHRGIEPGDRVRSYDWPQNIPAYLDEDDRRGGEECFVEGTVEAIEDHPGSPCRAYRINVERRVLGGEEEPIWAEGHEVVHAPVNGTPKMLGGVTFGVVRTEEEEEEEGEDDG